MKLKGKNRKNDIQKIHIDKDSLGSTVISYVINGQFIERTIPYVYIDSIFFQIMDDLDIILSDDYIIKK